MIFTVNEVEEEEEAMIVDLLLSHLYYTTRE